MIEEIVAHGDREQPGAALRDKPARIDHDDVERVSEAAHAIADVAQVAAAVRCEQTCHVLKEQRARRLAAAADVADQVQERPDDARVLAGQAAPVAGQREIDAGEGGGEQIERRGQVRQRQVGHIRDAQVLLAESRRVHFRFLRRDVVGEDALPAERLDCFAHEPNPGEEFGEPRHGSPSQGTLAHGIGASGWSVIPRRR